MTRAPKAPGRLARLLFTAAGAAVLAGCSQIGNPLDAFRAPPAPDEFMVISRAPIQVPAAVLEGQSAALPRPQPGAPSPLNPTPLTDAQQALLGNEGRERNDAAAPSQGEAALLAAAARDRDQSIDIRSQLEADELAEAEAAASAPYQPPTLIELLSGDEGEKYDPATLVDPLAESQRLQREGTRAPNNPGAAPPPAPEEEAAAQ